MSTKRALLLVLALALVPACKSGPVSNAEELSRLVAAYRAAQLSDKEAAALAIEQFKCTSKVVSFAYDACRRSAVPTRRALVQKREVKDALARIESGALAKDAPEALGLGAKLDAIERDLQAGRDTLPACADELSSLRRSLGIAK
jgi:hypothetical protein